MHRLCHIAHRRCCSNIHSGFTSYQALVTTAIDIADGAYSVFNSLTAIGLSSPPAFRHIDVHLGIAIDVSLETATIDIIYTRGRLHVHRDFSRCSNFSAIALRSWIRSLIATTKQILNGDRHTIVSLFDVDGDVATNTSCTVIAAIDILELTGFDGERYIVFDIGIIGAAIHVFNFGIISTRTAGDGNVNYFHIRLITCSVQTGQVQRTIIVCPASVDIHSSAQAFRIATTKDSTNLTTNRSYICFTTDYGTVVLIPRTILVDQVTTVTTSKSIAYIVRTIDLYM